MIKKLVLSAATLLGACAMQAQTATQVIQEMLTHSQSAPAANTIRAVSINVTISDNDKSYTVLDRLTKKTATQTVLGQTRTYNTLASNSSSSTLAREFTASNGSNSGTQVTCTAGTSFGWWGTTPVVLGGITITLPNGTKRSYNLPTNMTVTVLTAGSRYMLTGSIGTGKTVTMYIAKADIIFG